MQTVTPSCLSSPAADVNTRLNRPQNRKYHLLFTMLLCGVCITMNEWGLYCDTPLPNKLHLTSISSSFSLLRGYSIWLSQPDGSICMAIMQ